ncbi:hypothetical protein NMY22_g16783 [Coprinellus aureogranulatus]|nr:hypothetical protein NMY22_g16783 [Coprinellus aureogranulatus]
MRARNAGALWNTYTVDMTNVFDIQLLELAVRKSNRQYSKRLTGLAKAIPLYLPSYYGLPEWIRIKDAGQKLIIPEQGVDREVFEQRPLPEVLVRYAAQDVQLLARLGEVLRSRLGIRI